MFRFIENPNVTNSGNRPDATKPACRPPTPAAALHRAAQRKALGCRVDARPGGFVGGLRTEKYVSLTGVSRATAYRELTDLAERRLLLRTGQGRGTRYGWPEGMLA